MGLIMKKHPRILLAIDGSDRSFAAARYLGQVISKQSEIVLFHVMVEAPEAFRDLGTDPLTEMENYPITVWKTHQEETIREFMAVACDILVSCGFAKEAISVKTRAMQTGVVRDILRESQQDYSALVVGRTGISKIEGITLGSVAAKLVEGISHLPVVVVGERPDSPKILIALDGSKGSLKAVRCVAALFDPAACEILLCHVIRPLSNQQLSSKELFIPKHEADWIEANQRKIVPVIHEASRRLMDAGFAPASLSSEILTYQKSRAAALARAARDGGCDTIVLGRRGLTSVENFMIGRVSRKILHFAYQPALWIVN
jgi:nucleotide-binding universal stress UspA family protein